jgi:hypothetical protein
MSTTATKLNERNYRQWAIEAKPLLRAQGIWKYVSGEMRVPRPPIVASTSDASPTTTPAARDPRDPNYDFLTESTDRSYLNQIYHFLRDWERWQMNNDKACGQLTALMESTIQTRYRDLTEPNQLWDTIKSELEKVIKLDGRYKMAKLTSCQLESYPSLTEWISAQDKIITDRAVCDITIEDSWRKFCIMSNLPNTEEWRTFASTLELTETADTVASIVSHILSFEARLRRSRGLAPDPVLCITKEGRGRHSKGEKGNDRKGDDWKSQAICHGCGVKGHIKAKCRSKHKWAWYEKSKSDANLASTASTSVTESESFLFSVIHSDPIPDSSPDSVITVNVASANRSADYVILDTGATNHVTGNCPLVENFHSMAKGEHQVKTANNSFVDDKGSGTITFYVDRPNAKPAKIVLQHVVYVATCGTNNLLSIIQLMRKGVNFDFKLNGVTTSLGSVLVYEAPLINCLFVLRASTTSASVSKALVAGDDPPSTTPISEISEPYSNFRPVVDDKDILVWHARLCHLSLPAIKRLPNEVRGIQLHAMSRWTCTCEACIMGKMFRKPWQASEDNAKTRLLELIHSDVIRPMHTQMMRGYRFIIMFTDDKSRYTEVYFMTAKSEAPAKFKEYEGKLEKQHPRSKVSRISVDGGGEYASRGKFLEYMAGEGIIREVSAPYSQKQNGISERRNRTVLDPGRSMLKHAVMPNKLWAEAVSTAVYIKNRLPSRALPNSNSTPFER